MAADSTTIAPLRGPASGTVACPSSIGTVREVRLPLGDGVRHYSLTLWPIAAGGSIALTGTDAASQVTGAKELVEQGTVTIDSEIDGDLEAVFLSHEISAGLWGWMLTFRPVK